MDPIATIEFKDPINRDQGIVIVRALSNIVAICISIRADGDLECFVNAETAKQIAAAIDLASKRAKG